MRHRLPAIVLGSLLLGGFVSAVLYLEVRQQPAVAPPNVSIEGASQSIPYSEPGSAGDVRAEADDAASSAINTIGLHEMSESYRNATLLIAIRDAGFVCADVVAAHTTGGGVWTASCRDMLGYQITASLTGDLSVEPIPRYLDVPRSPPDREPLFDQLQQQPFER
jgi:hypothetical protein